MKQVDKVKAAEQLGTIIGKLEYWQYKYADKVDRADKAAKAKSELIELLNRIESAN